MANLKLTYEQEKNLILYLIHCVSWLCPVDCGKENQPGAGCTDSIINLKERSKFRSCQMAKGDASEHLYEKCEGESRNVILRKYFHLF